jgi:hypothetical protein
MRLHNARAEAPPCRTGEPIYKIRCSVLSFQQVLGENGQEEDGSIRKAHEADILASLDIVMDTIEEKLEEDAPPRPAATAQSQAISDDSMLFAEKKKDD